MAEMNYFFSNTASTANGMETPAQSQGTGQTMNGQIANGQAAPAAGGSAGAGSPGGGDYGIALPIAPPDSAPVAPLPSTPTFPTPTLPTPSLPSPDYPMFPNVPGVSSFSETRFLVAAANSFPVRLSVDSSVYDTNARFGTVTGRGFVSDGFHTVTVRRADDLRAILFQKNFPFRAGEKTTLIVIDSGQGGMDVTQVSDTGCRSLPAGSGCYRVANMSYDGSVYNVTLPGGGVIFRGVAYNTVTSFKQAMCGSYLFDITGAACCASPREISVIASAAAGSGAVSPNPLLSVSVEIQSGKSYTTYLIGNSWSEYSLRAVTLEA